VDMPAWDYFVIYVTPRVNFLSTHWDFGKTVTIIMKCLSVVFDELRDKECGKSFFAIKMIKTKF
jgi:hypothetical protein